MVVEKEGFLESELTSETEAEVAPEMVLMRRPLSEFSTNHRKMISESIRYTKAERLIPVLPWMRTLETV